MRATLIILLLAAGAGSAQSSSDSCCKHEQGSSGHGGDLVSLTAKEMRGHVDHIEPLQPSGLDKGLNLTREPLSSKSASEPTGRWYAPVQNRDTR